MKKKREYFLEAYGLIDANNLLSFFEETGFDHIECSFKRACHDTIMEEGDYSIHMNNSRLLFPSNKCAFVDLDGDHLPMQSD